MQSLEIDLVTRLQHNYAQHASKPKAVAKSDDGRNKFMVMSLLSHSLQASC